MMNVPWNELLITGGIVLMGLSVLAGIFSVILFRHLKKRLDQQLKQDYGEPKRYNR